MVSKVFTPLRGDMPHSEYHCYIWPNLTLGTEAWPLKLLSEINKLEASEASYSI